MPLRQRRDESTLSAFEQQAMVGMLDTLKGDITLGEEFVNK
jgi:malate dehydrogenase